MEHLFPPLLPKEALAPPVLAIAAHPDDEVIGCGAMLAWHRSREDAVTVVHLTSGAAGDPDGRFGDIADVRRGEGREALRLLGVQDIRTFDFPDGGLPERVEEVTATLERVFRELAPRTLYSFFYFESHRDHRAAARACARASRALPRECRCLLYGVNQVVAGGALFDTGAFIEQKRQALKAFGSQLAYNDFAPKVIDRDHAATVNVEDPAVQYAEIFADLPPGELERAFQLADPLYRYLLKAREGA